MREIVIVIPDLYLDPDSADSPPTAGALGIMPGFEHVARFGARRNITVDGGWRPWLARWLGRPDLAVHAPAAIVAAPLSLPGDVVARSAPSLSSPARAPGAGSLIEPNHASVPATVWLATPIHLIAGLTNLHLDRRGLLRLSRADLNRFAEDFNRTFGSGDLHLQPLPNGEFLLQAPAAWNAVTTEPARALVIDLESALPKGNTAAALKRLGAELEMWLHSHPANDDRLQRGEPPVSTLWLWGGGALESVRSASAPLTDVACGADPFLAGLWHLQGAPTRALPDRFGDLLNDPKSERATLVLEITPLLQTNPNWTVFEALVDLDRLYLSPALAALRVRALESVVLVANDMEVRLRPGDRMKFWRRSRPGIAALQPRST